jgi:ribose-phosphate pyrophosphokinase
MGHSYAARLDTSLAIIDKRRPKANVSEVLNIFGDVAGHNCLLVDDLIDTGGSLCNAAAALKKAGARSISACATHGVLSGPARQRLLESEIERVYVTNSISQDGDDIGGKLHVIDITQLLAEAIHRVHNFLSVSALFG